MERKKLVDIVKVAIDSCISAKQDRITNYFNNDEIYDFANTIVAYLPKNYQTLFTEVNRDVFEIFADKKDEVVNFNLQRLAREINLNELKKTDNEGTLVHIIFFALFKLLTQYNKDVDDVIDDSVNYYKSLLLPADRLKETISFIPDPGAVALFDNKGYYVRYREFDYSLVPSITTKQNFNYLIK